jgi:hypothetical protein
MNESSRSSAGATSPDKLKEATVDRSAALRRLSRTCCGARSSSRCFSMGCSMEILSSECERSARPRNDIGGAVAGFYGKDAGDKLTGLLKQHILIAVDLIAAAKANDQATYKATDHK